MFTTAVLLAALSAPVPKDKPSEPLMPVTVGTKRILEVTRGAITSETSEEVTKVTEKDGVYTITVESGAVMRSPGAKPPFLFAFVYEVSATKVADTRFDPARTIFDAGVKAGESWKHEPKGKAVTTFTVGKEEEVEVPAGKFKAVPVTEETEKLGRITRWYAPGVGVVKEVKDGFGKSTTVLKSITPGKGEKK